MRDLSQLEDVEMAGMLFQSIASACMNLRFVLGAEGVALLGDIEPHGWYPIRHYYRLVELVTAGYTDPGPILEQIGMNISRNWYEGGGKALITRSVDFLAIQVAGHGYHSVVRGPKEKLGKVSILYLNEPEGRAIIHTTTLTPRALQRGVYLGAFQIVGDMTFVQVTTSPTDADVLEIEFH